MKIFISWSGEPSRSVAMALRDWLPLVIQQAKPWMSDAEIESGELWRNAIARSLNEIDYGIICVTRSNQTAPWMIFEAGALAKQIDEAARVVPLCIEMAPADITAAPLAAFQAVKLVEDDLRRLVHNINKSCENPLTAEGVDRLFQAMWPQLKSKVDAALTNDASTEAPPHRSPDDMLSELVERVRDLQHRVERGSPTSYRRGATVLLLDGRVLEPGVVVEHSTFGTGVITGVSYGATSAGPRATISVRFDDGETRNLPPGELRPTHGVLPLQ